MTDPSRSQLPSIDEIKSGIVASVLRKSPNVDNNEGIVRDDEGQGYLFRLTKFALGEGYGASILLLAAQDDFVQNVRKLQFNGTDPRDHCRRGLHSDGLDIRQPMARSLKRHYRAGAKTPDAG